jgi:hypothetical protein
VSNGGNGGNNSGGGTNNGGGNVPVPSPVPSGNGGGDNVIDIDTSIYDGGIDPNDQEFDLDITPQNTGVWDKLQNSVASTYSQNADLTGALLMNCYFLDAGCNSAWLGSFFNAVGLLAKFLWGIIKGIGKFFVDGVGAIIDLIKAIPNIFNTIGGMFQSLGGLMNLESITNIFTQGAEKSNQGINSIIDDFNSKNIWDKYEHIGYWLGYIGVTIFTIYKTITEIVASIPSLISKAKSLASSVGNFAKALVSNGRITLSGISVAVKTYGNVVKVTGGEIVNLIRQGKWQSLQKIIKNPSPFIGMVVKGCEFQGKTFSTAFGNFKIPTNWNIKIQNQMKAIIYENPNNPLEQIRIVTGSTSGKYPRPNGYIKHDIINQATGKPLSSFDVSGKSILSTSAEAHFNLFSNPF